MSQGVYDVKLIDHNAGVATDAIDPANPLTALGGYSWPSGILGVIATSTDTVDAVAELWLCDATGSKYAMIGATIIPAGAGDGTVPAVDLLDNVPIPANGILVVAALWTVKLYLQAAPSSGKQIHYMGTYGLM
jgi:hypothetical protein